MMPGTLHDGSPGAEPVSTAALGQLPFFTGLAEPVLAALTTHAQVVDLPTGEPLIEQNDDADGVFVLLDGAIEVLLRYEGVGDLFMGTLDERGTLFGWSAFRPPYRYAHSARCEGPARLLRIPRSGFEAVMGPDPAVAYALLARVAVQVMRQIDLTRGLLEQRANETETL